MRLLLLLSLLLFLTLGFGVKIQQDMLHMTKTMRADVKLLQGLMKEEKWQEAEEKMKEVEALWESHRKTAQLFGAHRNLDELEVALTRAKSLIQGKHRLGAEVFLSHVALLLKRIQEKEAFSLYTIF